jgi:tagatose 1,6-diphosphate aldolase
VTEKHRVRPWWRDIPEYAKTRPTLLHPAGTVAIFRVSNELVQNELDAFRFLDPGELRDDDIILSLAATQPADPAKNWVPYYVFHIMSAKTERRAGEIHLRVGNTDHMRLYGGHVAYGVRPEFRGNHFAARALRLLMPLARRHGLSELWITCNPENVASRRTCELVGAELIEIVDMPPMWTCIGRASGKNAGTGWIC